MFFVSNTILQCFAIQRYSEILAMFGFNQLVGTSIIMICLDSCQLRYTVTRQIDHIRPILWWVDAVEAMNIAAKEDKMISTK